MQDFLPKDELFILIVSSVLCFVIEYVLELFVERTFITKRIQTLSMIQFIVFIIYVGVIFYLIIKDWDLFLLI
jgi:hypothetical protein